MPMAFAAQPSAGKLGRHSALDGTASIAQPLIQRLYSTRTRDEYPGAGLPTSPSGRLTISYETLARAAKGNSKSVARVLNDGMVPQTPSATSRLRPIHLTDLPAPGEYFGPNARSVSPILLCGTVVHSANNPWLQECQHTLSAARSGATPMCISTRRCAASWHREGDTVTSRSQTKLSGASILMPGQAKVYGSKAYGVKDDDRRAGSAMASACAGLGWDPSSFPLRTREGQRAIGKSASGKWSFARPRPLRAERPGTEELFKIDVVSAGNAEKAAPTNSPEPAANSDTGRLCLGHGDPHGFLYRLQRVRHRLPGREQRSCRRPGGNNPGPGYALASCGFPMQHDQNSARNGKVSSPYLACIANCTLRAGLSGPDFGA